MTRLLAISRFLGRGCIDCSATDFQVAKISYQLFHSILSWMHYNCCTIVQVRVIAVWLTVYLWTCSCCGVGVAAFYLRTNEAVYIACQCGDSSLITHISSFSSAVRYVSYRSVGMSLWSHAYRLPFGCTCHVPAMCLYWSRTNKETILSR